MTNFAHLRRAGLTVVAAGLVTVLLTACPGPPVSRDRQDTTAPALAMSIAGTKANPGGVDDVAFGSATDLSAAGAQILIKAADSGGVSFVELWMTEKEICGGVIVGSGLAGRPSARTDGTVTTQDAPSTLTAVFRIEATTRKKGCTYNFEVWGAASNAADTPAHVKSAKATVTLRT